MSTLQKDHSIKHQPQDYLIIQLDKQLFGIKTKIIQEITPQQPITPIPLTDQSIVGLINLRGITVTAIDLRHKLNISPYHNTQYKNIIITLNQELYCLAVDQVQEITNIHQNEISPTPDNLSQTWKNASTGVYTHKNELVLILDIQNILASPSNT